MTRMFKSGFQTGLEEPEKFPIVGSSTVLSLSLLPLRAQSISKVFQPGMLCICTAAGLGCSGRWT